MHSKLTVLSGEEYFPSSAPSPAMQKLEPTNTILSLRNNFIQAMQQRNQSQNPNLLGHSQETVKTAGEMHQQELQMLYSIPAVSPSMRPSMPITSGRRMDGNQVSVTVNSSTRNIPAQAARFPLLVESSRGSESEQSQFSNRKAFQQNGTHDSGQDHTRPVTARSSKSSTTAGLKFFSSVKKLKLEQEKGTLLLDNKFQMDNNQISSNGHNNNIVIRNKNLDEDSEDKDHLMKAVCTPKASGNLIMIGSSGKKSEKRRNKTSSKKGTKSGITSKKINKNNKNGDNHAGQTNLEGSDQKKDEKVQEQYDREDIQQQQPEQIQQQVDHQLNQQQEQKKMPSKKSHRKSQSQSSLSMQRLVKEIESKKTKQKNSSNCLQIFTKLSSPSKKSSNLHSPVNQSLMKQLQNNVSQNIQSLTVSTLNSPKQQQQSTSTTTTIAVGQSNTNQNQENNLNVCSQQNQEEQIKVSSNYNETDTKPIAQDVEVKQEQSGTVQLLPPGKNSKHRQTNSLTSNPLSSKYGTQNVSPISSFVFLDSNQTSFVQKQKSSDIWQSAHGHSAKISKDLTEKKRQEEIMKQQSLLLRANLKGKNEQIRKKNLSSSKLAKNPHKLAETAAKQKFIPWGIDQQKLQKYFLKGAVGQRGIQACEKTEEGNGTSSKKPDVKQRRIQLGLDCLNQLNESKIESLLQNQRKKGICSTHHESHIDESKQQQHSMQLKYSQQQDQPLSSTTHKREITLEQKKLIQQFMASKKRQGEVDEERRKKEQLLRQERLKLNLQLLNEEIKGSLQLSSKHTRCSSNTNNNNNSNNNNNTLNSPSNNGQPNSINLHLSEKINYKDKEHKVIDQIGNSRNINEKLQQQQQPALSQQTGIPMGQQQQQKDHHPLSNYKLPQPKTATPSAVNQNSYQNENDLKDPRSCQASGCDFTSSSSLHPAQSNQNQSNGLQSSNSSSHLKKRKIKSQKQTKSLSTISASNLPVGSFISPVTPSEVSSRIANTKYFFNAPAPLSPQNEDQVCDFINDEYKKYFNWREAFSDSNVAAQLKVQLPGQISTSSSKKRSKLLRSHNSASQQVSLKIGLDQENVDKIQKYSQNDYVINQDQYECFEQLSSEQGYANCQQGDFGKTTAHPADQQNAQLNEKRTAEEMTKEFEERKNQAYLRFGKLAQRLQNSVFLQMKQSQMQYQHQMQMQSEEQLQSIPKLPSPLISTQPQDNSMPSQIDKPKEENQIKSDAGEGALSRVPNGVMQSVTSDTNALELYHNTDEDEMEEHKQKVQQDSKNETNPKTEYEQQEAGLFQDQVMSFQGFSADKQKDIHQNSQDSFQNNYQSANNMRSNELQAQRDESRDNLAAAVNANNVTKSVEDIMEGSSQRFKERTLPETIKQLQQQKRLKEAGEEEKNEHKRQVIFMENQKDKGQSNQMSQQIREQQSQQADRELKQKQNIDFSQGEKQSNQIEKQQKSDLVPSAPAEKDTIEQKLLSDKHATSPHLSNEDLKNTFKTEDFQHDRKRGGQLEEEQEDYDEDDEDQSLLRMRQINEQFYSRPHNDDIGEEKQSLSQQIPTVHSDFNISGENKENDDEIHELDEEEREGMILLNLAAIYIQKIWRGYFTRKIISQFYDQLEEEYYRSQEQQQEEQMQNDDGIVEAEKDADGEDEAEIDERIDPNDLLQQSPSIDGIGSQKGKSVQSIEQKYQKILTDDKIKETESDEKKKQLYQSDVQEKQEDHPAKQSEIEAIQLAEKCMRSCEEMRQEQLSKWTQLIEQLQEFKSNGLVPPQQKEFLDNLCEQYEANKKELLSQGGIQGEVKLNKGTEEDQKLVPKISGVGQKQEQQLKEKTPSKQETLKQEELEIDLQSLSNAKKSSNNTNSTPKKPNSSSKKERDEEQINGSPTSDIVRQSKGSQGEQSQQQLGSLSKSALSDIDNTSSICSSRNEGREIVNLEKFQLSSLKRESMDELFKMREEVISFQKEAKIDIIRQMLEDKRVSQQTYEEKKKDIEAWVVREREKVRRTHHEIERGWKKFAETVRQTKRGLHFMKQVKSQQHSQNNNMPKYHSAKRSLSTVELDRKFSKLLSFSDLKDGELNKGQLASANNQNSFRSFGSGTPTNLKLIHVQRAATKHLPNKQFPDAHSHRNLTYSAAPSSKSCMSWDGHVLLTNNSEEGEFEDINDYLLKMKSLASRNFQTLKDNQMMQEKEQQQQQYQAQQQQVQSLNDMGPISSLLIGQEVLPKVATKDIAIDDNELDNPSLKSFILEGNNNNSITKLDPTLNSIMLSLSNKDDKVTNINISQNNKRDMQPSSPPHSPINFNNNNKQSEEQNLTIPANSKDINEDTVKQQQNPSEEDPKSDLVVVSQTNQVKSVENDNLQADRLEIKEFQASDNEHADQYNNSKLQSEQVTKTKENKLGSPKSKVDQLAYYSAKELGKLNDNQENEGNSEAEEGDALKVLENNDDNAAQLRINDIKDTWMESEINQETDAQNEMMMVKNMEEIITPIESCQNLNSIKDFLVALAEFIKENFREELLTRINQPLGIDPLEFLKTFNITENTEPQDTDTSNGPIYPIVKYIHIQKPVVSEEIFLTFNELYQRMLRRQKKMEAQAAGLEKDFLEDDEEEEDEDIDIFNSQSDIEKYNLKLVFDCFNESLDFIRPFSLSGKPLPWKLNQKKLATVNVRDEDVEKVLGMAIGRMLKWGSCLCGFISEKIEFPLGQEEENKEYLNQIKEDRLAQMLENEVVENEQKWLIYEDEETDVQLEIADDIFHYLMSETAQWIYLKMQDKLEMMDSLEIAFGKTPGIEGQEIADGDENDGQGQLLDYSSALDISQKHREMENISQSALGILQHHNSIVVKGVADAGDLQEGNNLNNHKNQNKELEQKEQQEQMVLQEGQNQEKQQQQTSSIEKRRKAQMVEINSKQNEHFIRPSETPTHPISMKHSF